MAEFDTYHDQKVEDFRSLTTDFLDCEIALHEQVGLIIGFAVFANSFVFLHSFLCG
jgi:hypothetical protein